MLVSATIICLSAHKVNSSIDVLINDYEGHAESKKAAERAVGTAKKHFNADLLSLRRDDSVGKR